jgi:hypothetical protein
MRVSRPHYDWTAEELKILTAHLIDVKGIGLKATVRIVQKAISYRSQQSIESRILKLLRK